MVRAQNGSCFSPNVFCGATVSTGFCSMIRIGPPAEFSYVLSLNANERRVDEVSEKLLSKFFYCLQVLE